MVIFNGKLQKFKNAWIAYKAVQKKDIPCKSGFGLAQLGALAQHTLLFSLSKSGDLTIPRSGSMVDGWWGRNLSGVHCSEILTPQAYKETKAFHEKIITDPCGGFVHEWLDHVSGERLECQSLVLPLAPESEDILGYTISMSMISGKDYAAYQSGVYQSLTSREIIALDYFDLND